MISKSFTFSSLPKNVSEISALPEADLTSPFKTAALTVLALCEYEENRETSIDMLNFLKGPQELSTYEKQFLNDRMMGKTYIPFSYIDGASPQNNYTVSAPYTITVFDNPYSYDQAGYAKLYIKSGGADNARPLTLRQKGDKWYLWEQFLMVGIRIPAKEDPWA